MSVYDFPEAPIVPELPDSINWAGFSFDEYFTCEQTILKPQLESLGYSEIKFWDGERDSFGPLSRMVGATKDGKRVKFCYG